MDPAQFFSGVKIGSDRRTGLNPILSVWDYLGSEYTNVDIVDITKRLENDIVLGLVSYYLKDDFKKIIGLTTADHTITCVRGMHGIYRGRMIACLYQLTKCGWLGCVGKC